MYALLLSMGISTARLNMYADASLLAFHAE
jgi:hypothetical protein